MDAARETTQQAPHLLPRIGAAIVMRGDICQALAMGDSVGTGAPPRAALHVDFA